MRGSRLAALSLVMLGAAAGARASPQTTTPIEHLIVVVGENISFDNLFATYQPKSGAEVHNLLSQRIVDRDGSPGPEFAKAAQRRAEVRDTYQVTPRIVGTYRELPRPGTTHAAGEPRFVPDLRSPPLLPNGPFQITKYVDYTAHVGDPVHRFFQMWQQVDGGRRDLFVWVAETSGEGSRNRADPASGTNQGALAMGFYNMAAGDAPYFRLLADRYALSDNHHQSVMGGTGANFQALATGHAIAYSENGAPRQPPQNQIENPDPRPGTNNWYTQSGYTSGSYTKCSDPNEPGVKAIRAYLASLPYPAFNDGNCEPGAYYLVNNYSAGFTATGEPAPLGPEIFRVPPQARPTIAEALSAKGVGWKWYSGGRRADGITREYCGYAIR
jgi:phospholipase C